MGADRRSGRALLLLSWLMLLLELVSWLLLLLLLLLLLELIPAMACQVAAQLAGSCAVAGM